MEMFSYIEKDVDRLKDDDALIQAYLARLLRTARPGTAPASIYGMGHAVYTLSDPRAVLLKKYARQHGREQGLCWTEFRAAARRWSALGISHRVAGEQRQHPHVRQRGHVLRTGLHACWASRRSCTRPCSPSPASPAGAPTGIEEVVTCHRVICARPTAPRCGACALPPSRSGTARLDFNPRTPDDDTDQ